MKHGPDEQSALQEPSLKDSLEPGEIIGPNDVSDALGFLGTDIDMEEGEVGE